MSYNKKIWKNGDLITKEGMNNIENGIYMAHDEIEALKNNTPTGGSNINDTTASATTTYSSNKIENIKEGLSSQIKEIVNVADLAQEGNNVYIKDSNGNKIGDGITIQASSNEIELYKLQPLGTLFDNFDGYTYICWCSNSLHYDKNINRYVGLLWARDGHVSCTKQYTYRILINPKTYEVTDLDKVVLYDTDGTTEIVVDQLEGNDFLILKDGTYIWNMYTDMSTYVGSRWTSTDYGKTWIKTADSRTGAYYKITELSNGRLLYSSTAKNSGIWYSDDKGISMTRATITGGTGTSYGDYVGEWFFLELKENTVMAIGRKNGGGSAWQSPALITYSTDNGTTWGEIHDSTSITHMNGSNATGIIHDGIVELFTCSRWYIAPDTSIVGLEGEGKHGAMFHYTATVEDALNDAFECKGIVLYSKIEDDYTSNAAQDFHGPHLAYNENTKEILIEYYDRVDGMLDVESANNYFVRGKFNSVDNMINDDVVSSALVYSNKKVDTKLQEQKDTILKTLELKNQELQEQIYTLQYYLSKIEGSGVGTPDVGDGILWTVITNASDNMSLLNSSNPFYSYITQGVGSACTIGTDTLGNNIFNINNLTFKIPSTKANFAIEIATTIESSTPNWNSIGHIACIYDSSFNYVDMFWNGYNVGTSILSSISLKSVIAKTYNDSKSIVLTRRLVKRGNTITVTVIVDGEVVAENIDVSDKSYETTDVMDTTGIYIHPAKAYVHYIKFGEWD